MKEYCLCFANGTACTPDCRCEDCGNTPEDGCSRDSTLHGTVDVTTVGAGKSIVYVFKTVNSAVRVASVRIVRINLVIITISLVCQRGRRKDKENGKKRDHGMVRFDCRCFCRGCVNIFVNNVLMCVNKLIMYVMFDVTLA